MIQRAQAQKERKSNCQITICLYLKALGEFLRLLWRFFGLASTASIQVLCVHYFGKLTTHGMLKLCMLFVFFHFGVNN